jgi:hypothetical protein
MRSTPIMRAPNPTRASATPTPTPITSAEVIPFRTGAVICGRLVALAAVESPVEDMNVAAAVGMILEDVSKNSVAAVVGIVFEDVALKVVPKI